MNWTMLAHAGALTLTVMALSTWMPGVHSESKATSLWVALVFSVLNVGAVWLMRRFVHVEAAATLAAVAPFLLNVIVLWFTDKMVPSFEISNKLSLVVAAAIIAVVNRGVDLFLASHGQKVLDAASKAAGLPG